MEYYVYILQSEADQSYYIGYTSNPDERLKKHNSGHSRYTSKKIPWKLIYIEPFANKSEAIVREKFLKRQRNREYYKKLINGER